MKRVVITAIPGTIDESKCLELEHHSFNNGLKLKFFHPGQKMFKVAKEEKINITPANVLDAPHDTLTLLRRVGIDETEKEIIALPDDTVAVIRTHTTFIHRDVPRRAWRSKAIAALKPDMFITFVDDAKRILDNLNQTPQWMPMNFSLKEVLYWLNTEVNITDDWADLQGKPFYVVPTTAPPDFFYRLIAKPGVGIIYSSMPLTHAYDETTQKQVDGFVKFLHKYFKVIDPRYIDPIAASKTKEFDLAVYNNVVNRDLYWFIRQSERVIAYFPKVVLSAGMIDEIVKAFEGNKEVWLV